MFFLEVHKQFRLGVNLIRDLQKHATPFKNWVLQLAYYFVEALVCIVLDIFLVFNVEL
jgi:hypothetical protein